MEPVEALAGPDPTIGAITYVAPQPYTVDAARVPPDVGLTWLGYESVAPSRPADSLEPPDYEGHARTPAPWPVIGLLRRMPWGARRNTGGSHQPIPRALPGAPRQGMTPIGITPRIYRPEVQGWDEGVEVGGG